MKSIRTIQTSISIFIFAAALAAQENVFEWQDVSCQFKGTYDSEKYDEKTLQDTRALIDFGFGLPLQTDQTVFDVAKISSLDVNELDAEYFAVKKRLEGLNPVENEYFRSLKKRHLDTLDASYRLKRVTLVAHFEPKVLEFAQYERACFVKWGQPVIEGGQSLLDAWRKLTDEQKTRNASPEGVEARYRGRFNSSARDKWALVDVLGFGWWNCVNKSIPYVESDGTPEEEFKKLFEKVDNFECDEP